MKAQVHKSVEIPDGPVFGENVKICEYCVVRPDIVLGDNVEIKPVVVLANGLRVGKDTIMGAASMALEKTHEGDCKGVTIGERCFIGAGAILLPGVTIGNDVIIGAGSVVTKDCLEPGLYMGTPCRKIERK